MIFTKTGGGQAEMALPFLSPVDLSLFNLGMKKGDVFVPVDL